MRCQRMTLSVKHYSNTGGAVTNRDNKGIEERRNIAILKKKWPNCFRDNPKRKNEVIMRWPKSMNVGGDAGSEDDEDLEDEAKTKAKAASLNRQPKKVGPKVIKIKKVGKVKKTA